MEKIRRAIRINFNDGTYKDLELTMATAIKSKGRIAIEIEQMKDESWRLTFNENIIKDFSTVKNLEVIREN